MSSDYDVGEAEIQAVVERLGRSAGYSFRRKARCAKRRMPACFSRAGQI
jgi:hypothetical protein